MVTNLLVKSSSPNYLELTTEAPRQIAGLCHQFGVVPQSVVAVTVTFIREDLTRENYNDKLQGRGDDQDDIFACLDPDHG